MDIKNISCEEYSNQLNNRFFFDIFMEEMISSEHFEAIVLFNHMKKQAELENIYLIDEDTWDYEQYFDGIYSAKESLIKK